MNTKQKTGLAIGAAVIGIGAAFGVGYAFSGAATNSQAQTQPSQGSGQGEGPGGGGQGRGGGMGNMSNFAKALAEKLGVDESKVIAALQEAMQGSRPSGDASQGAQPGGGASPGAMPSGAPSNGTGGGGPNGGGGPGGGSGMDEQLAKTLAEKLGLDEDKVAKAIEEVRSEQQADQPSRDASQPSPRRSDADPPPTGPTSFDPSPPPGEGSSAACALVDETFAGRARRDPLVELVETQQISTSSISAGSGRSAWVGSINGVGSISRQPGCRGECRSASR